jgi:hypothetical protein
MKKIIMILVFTSSIANVLSQEIQKDKAYYQTRSKKQKSAAYGLLIGGGVAIGLGFLIGDRKESSYDDAGTGAIIGGLGVLAMLGSVPLFIASGKNKRKASLMVSTKTLPPVMLVQSRKKMLNIGISVPL